MTTPYDDPARLSMQAMGHINRREFAAARDVLDQAIEQQRWLITSGVPEGKIDLATLYSQLADAHLGASAEPLALDAVDRALALLGQVNNKHELDDRLRAAKVALGIAAVIEDPRFAPRHHRALILCYEFAESVAEEQGFGFDTAELLLESAGRLARISMAGMPPPGSLSWDIAIAAAHHAITQNQADIVVATNAIATLASVACALAHSGRPQDGVELLEAARAAGQDHPPLQPGAKSALLTAGVFVGSQLCDRPADRSRVAAVCAAASRW